METIIKTQERRYISAHYAERWQFIRDERGVRAEAWFDVNRLSAEERHAYDSEVAAYPGFDDAVEPGPQAPRFPSVILAERWAALQDEHISISIELDAYNAPPECDSIARRSLLQREAALLALEVK